MSSHSNLTQITLVISLIFCGFFSSAQNQSDTREGSVSYVTSQNVYVKFQSTTDIAIGDTLYMLIAGKPEPAMIVNSISSISCVCSPLSDKSFKVGDAIQARPGKPQTSAAVLPVATTPAATVAVKTDSAVDKKVQTPDRKQDISGNVTVASYLNFSNATTATQRMRYTVAFNVDNIGESKLSLETYFTFAHKLGQWDEIQSDIFNGLKVYNLSFNYKFNKHHQVWLGRKINPRMSNVGAIDGIQYEYKLNGFSVGVVGGTRPDYRNYSFNGNLLQFGGYLGHDLVTKKGNMQTTLAFMQQTNNGHTDRSFAYLQHVNALVKNLYFFGSVEMDLYNQSYNAQDSTLSKDNAPKLSNLYLSLRYRPWKVLSLSLSYSARQNIIYYESYKDIVETMLEAATVNGYLLQISYSPVKNLSIGLNTSYRDSKKDPRPTKSLYGYVTIARVPGINASATLSATILETSYMTGKIFSASFSRELVSGKLNAGLGYRFVDYNFASGETTIYQHMPEVNLTWRIIKKLSCSLYYEGTFDNNSTFNRVYINLTKRF